MTRLALTNIVPVSSVLRVLLTSNQSISDSTQTVVKFNAVTTDTQSAYSAVTGLYTPTRAGNYLVSVALTCQVVTATTALFGYLLKGATIVSRIEVGPYTAAAAQSGAAAFSDIINVNGSTDTISANVYHIGTGGSNAIVGSTTPFTFMSITYLGT